MESLALLAIGLGCAAAGAAVGAAVGYLDDDGAWQRGLFVVLGLIGILGVVDFSKMSDAACRAERGAQLGESVPECEYTAWGFIGALILGLLACGVAYSIVRDRESEKKRRTAAG